MSVFVSLLLVQSAYALQELAGPLAISVPIGGNNSVRWGLINDGNETITVTLSASGDAAKYITFPATVELVPHQTVYTNIAVNIPANYNISSGRNITGSLYALQQGKPGQVQINVQLTKSLTITVIRGTAELQTSTAGNSNSIQSSQITGLGALFSGNYLAIFLIFIAFAFFVIKSFPRKP